MRLPGIVTVLPEPPIVKSSDLREDDPTLPSATVLRDNDCPKRTPKNVRPESGAVVNTYDGGVASTTSDYSSKEWATGATATSAKDYATKTSGAVTLSLIHI